MKWKYDENEKHSEKWSENMMKMKSESENMMRKILATKKIRNILRQGEREDCVYVFVCVCVSVYISFPMHVFKSGK